LLHSFCKNQRRFTRSFAIDFRFKIEVRTTTQSQRRDVIVMVSLPRQAPRGLARPRFHVVLYRLLNRDRCGGATSVRGLLVINALAGLLNASSAMAQPAPVACDTALMKRARGTSFGYGPRGDRCEGTYAGQVAGTVLPLASLTESFEFDPRNRGELTIEWPDVGASVFLEAQSIKQNVYFRMDRVQPAGRSTYGWPTTGLTSQGLTRNQLGIRASMMRAVGGVQSPVYVPVRVRQTRDSVPDGKYDLVLYPAGRISELYLTVARLNERGERANYLVREAPQSCRYCAAQVPITLRLDMMDLPGIYEVGITAKQATGRNTSASFLVYHSGSR
jgi:hypothetical protein